MGKTFHPALAGRFSGTRRLVSKRYDSDTVGTTAAGRLWKRLRARTISGTRITATYGPTTPWVGGGIAD